ncbi:MAG: hypothetical protein AAFY48_06975 [Bacteroidota bacterium]
MKKINLILFGLMLLLVGTSCEKDRNFVEFADLETGAYARELSRDGNFFFTDPSNSMITASVEFYDVNQGQDVSSYSWSVSYIDKTNGGADNAGPADILTINSSEFGTSPSGLPSADFSFTLQEALDALGLTIDDVTGGSTMRYNATVTMKDGRTFTAANTGNNIVSSAAFRALFSFDANLLCTSTLAGELNYVTTNGVTAGGGGPECPPEDITGTVTLTETGPGAYEISDASFGVFGACWSDTPAEGISFIDACFKVTTEGADQYGDTYTYDIIDVSGTSMTIEWVNSFGDGGTTVLTRADGMDWPPLEN